MGMFDWYKPAEDLQCPVCKVSLNKWQGKDGENALFLWSEGSAAPVDQPVEEEWKISEAARAQFRLPEEFEIYSYDCEKHRVTAKCKTRSGTWCETELVKTDDC